MEVDGTAHLQKAAIERSLKRLGSFFLSAMLGSALPLSLEIGSLLANQSSPVLTAGCAIAMTGLGISSLLSYQSMKVLKSAGDMN